MKATTSPPLTPSQYANRPFCKGITSFSNSQKQRVSKAQNGDGNEKMESHQSLSNFRHEIQY
jgi:hypothetical protein